MLPLRVNSQVFKELQISLYDIFGYLLPGAIIFFALVVIFWSLFWPTLPLALKSSLPLMAIVGLIFGAYLLGHLGQGIGNLVEKLPVVKRRREANLPLSAELAELVRDAVAVRFGKKARSLNLKDISLLCDQALVFAGSSGDREIFVYREGFYRGNSVALALLAVALMLRLAVGSPTLVAFECAQVEIHRSQVALAVLIAGFGALLSFLRYLRFGDHKNSTCVTRFLALASEQLHEKEKKSS